jgi:hypothetical protein
VVIDTLCSGSEYRCEKAPSFGREAGSVPKTNVFDTRQGLASLNVGIQCGERRKYPIMNSAICEAISRRAVIQFSYGGLRRTAEPHLHGISTAGNEVLRAYQIGGYSKSGRVPSWRLYEVSRMSGIRQTGEVFVGSRPDYHPNDQDMISVHCRI